MADTKPNEEKNTEFTHLGGQDFDGQSFELASLLADKDKNHIPPETEATLHDPKADDFHDKTIDYNHANAGAAGSIAGTIETAAAEKHQQQEEEEKKERARNFLTQGAISEILSDISDDIKAMKKDLTKIDCDFKELEQEAQQLIDEMKVEQTKVEDLLTKQKEDLAHLKEQYENGDFTNNEEYHLALIEQKEAEIENTQAVLDMYKENIESSTETLNNARQEVGEAYSQLASVEAQLKRAQKDNPDVTEAQLDALREQRDALREEIRQATVAIEKAKSNIEFSKANMEFYGEHLKEESMACWIHVEDLEKETEGIKAKTELLKKTNDIAEDGVINKTELAEFLAMSKDAGVEESAKTFAQNIQAAGYTVELEDGTFASGADAEQAILDRWSALNEKAEELKQDIEEKDQKIEAQTEDITEVDTEIAAKEQEIAAKEQEIAEQASILEALQENLASAEEHIARETAELSKIEQNVNIVENSINTYGSIIEFMGSKHDVPEALAGVEVDREQILTHEGQPVFMDNDNLQLYTVGTDAEGNKVPQYITDPTVKMDLQAQIFAEDQYPANFVKGVTQQEGESAEDFAKYNESLDQGFHGYYDTMAMSGLGYAAEIFGSKMGMTNSEARELSQNALEEQKEIIAQHARPALEANIAQTQALKEKIESTAQEIQEERQLLEDEKHALESEKLALIEQRDQQQEELSDVQEEMTEIASNHNLNVPTHNLDEIAAAKKEMNNLFDQALTRNPPALTEIEIKQVLDGGIITYEDLDLSAENAGVLTPEEMNLGGYDQQEDQPTAEEQVQLTATFSQANPQPDEVDIIPTTPAANGSVFSYGKMA